MEKQNLNAGSSSFAYQSSGFDFIDFIEGLGSNNWVFSG